MLMHSWFLAWQLHRQQVQQPSRKNLRRIYIILMVFIVTLTQSSHSIQQYLQDNLANLLGADVVISTSNPLSIEQQRELQQLSNKVVATQTIATTLTHRQRWQQVMLKAVPQDYPLQGQLRVSEQFNGDDMAIAQGPAVGDIWLDSRLLASLSLAIGDELTLANKTFHIRYVLTHEPDRLMQGHSVDMRAMINLADLADLIVNTDISTYRYLIAANRWQTAPLLQWQKGTLPAAELFHKQGAHPLALFWQRVENFVGLASIVLFFMAAIAIEQLSRVHIAKEQYFCAVCMSIGASRKQTVYLSILTWFIAFVSLLPWVVAIAMIAHFVIIQWLAQSFHDLVWQWHWWVAIGAMAATCALLLVAQLPVWYALKHASVGKLLHSFNSASSTIAIKVCSVSMLALVAFAYSDNGLLTAMILTSILVCVLVIVGLSWLTLTVGEAVSKNVSGLLPFSLFMMKQRLVTKSTQILGAGLSAFLLLFTLSLLTDLGQTMQAYQRQHDGNLLVSQANKPQMRAIEQWAEKQQITIRQLKPFYYAKLVGINNRPIAEHTQKPSESLATMQRAIRLHWTDDLPANNRLVNGTWWSYSKSESNWQRISVEDEVMTDLGLELGDTLSLFINNRAFDFTIAATHAYKSGAGAITFWLQMPASAATQIDAVPYYMASLELQDAHFSLLGKLWQQFPTLRMISLQQISERFDNTLAMVTQVISGFSALIILLAGIVMTSSIQAMEIAERKKNSVILSFGLNKRTTLQLNVIEWLTTGGIAAFGAIVSTYLAGALIYKSQFSLIYQPSITWLLATLLITLLVITSIGVLASKNSLKSSIRDLLAE